LSQALHDDGGQRKETVLTMDDVQGRLGRMLLSRT